MLSNGGKRARPVLVMMACELFTDDAEVALPAALAIEIFHNCTLVHDDIMDEAPLRRNKATVHEKWGNNVGILSGDTMMVQAYEQLSKCAPQHLHDVLTVFNSAALQVCEGQQMDMNFQQRSDVTIQEYIRMIEFKTSTLLAASLKMGAILGGASDQQAELLWNFGRNIGIAFQLLDDMLDVYGEEGKFGKQVGGDIVAGKRTFLLLKALELADEEMQNELSSLATGVNTDTQVKVTSTKEIFDRLNIRAIALEEVRKFHDQGMENLEDLDIEPSKKALLKEMAEGLLNREI
ncbi:MAG: polyprenyl synthetase family protein [Flavobacteriales bacterium]|nr:polyprenyl synthetase family protein [Flavobacteriales bacterium]